MSPKSSSNAGRWPRRRKWQLAAVVLSTLLALLVVLVASSPLGSRFHKLLAESAGRFVGAVKGNLAVVVGVSIACVVGAWLFIGAKCFLEGRRDDR